MKTILKALPLLVLLVGACATPAAPPMLPPLAGEPAALLRLHEQVRVPAIETRRFTHQELWSSLEPIVDGTPLLTREEIGHSTEGRPLQAVRFGHGPIRVLLWSQMHGDESTATLSLLDLFHHIARAPTDPLVERLRERLTVVAVPMLNPDGAERFQRRNALGVDINRDARMLSTPEARALRSLQRELRPEFGFNLHDQNPRIRVGDTQRVAAISLLAPPYDVDRSDNAVRTRAKRLAGHIRGTAEALVPQHVARYDDTFNPRAFGDLMQSWGTSTVLVESGGWRDDTEKQHLRAVNFVLLLRALDAISSGVVDAASTDPYESLPENGSLASDLLVLGGTLVTETLPPLRADLAANFRDSLRRDRASITEVGDLREVVAIDTLDVTGLYLHVPTEAMSSTHAGPVLAPGSSLTFTARRSADPVSPVVLRVRDGRVEGR